MNIQKLNAALRLRNIIPPGIYDNSENFVEFLKAYYEWLHTSTFEIYDISGTFVAGEYIVGDISKSTGKIVQIKTGKLIVFIESSLPFQRSESFTGQTSGATAKLDVLTDNISRTAANLVDYRDLEKSVDKFADYLKFELYQSIPNEISGDKFLLTKKIKDFYQSKSQESAYRYLFKSLFNQEIEILYPGEDIIRVSDGKFVKTKVLRAVVNANIFDFLFKTVRGTTSNAIANVVDIKLIYIGSIQVAEMTLSLVSGTFVSGETIVDVLDSGTSTTLYGVISGFTINNPGTGYAEGDVLDVVGDGQSAIVSVESVYKSPIDRLKINAFGQGYRLDTYATVNNTGTNGSGLSIKITGIEDTYTVTDGATNYTVGRVSDIRIVNKGYGYNDIPTITLVDTTIRNLGLLHENLFQIVNSGNNYTVGDWLTFTSAYGANANAIISSVVESDVTLLLENDSTILLEDSSYLKNENATLIGPINKVKVTNYGSGYAANSLPTITINTPTGSNGNIIVLGLQGTGANVEVDSANNTGGIGAIRSISITDFGADYTTATVDASLVGNGDANVTPIISGIGISSGQFINDDGKIDYKKIQDSYYYQDFSYVIRSGIEISTYKDIVKKIIHPAGLEFFGEIRIVSEFEVTMDAVSEINLEHVGAWIFTFINQIQTKSQISSGKKLEVDIIPDKVTGTTISAIEPEKHIIAPKGIVTIKADIETPNNKAVELEITLDEEAITDAATDVTNKILAQKTEVASQYEERETQVEVHLTPDLSSDILDQGVEIEVTPDKITSNLDSDIGVDVLLQNNANISSQKESEEIQVELRLIENLSSDVLDEGIEIKLPLQKLNSTFQTNQQVEIQFIQNAVNTTEFVEEKKTILLKDSSGAYDARMNFDESTYRSEILLKESLVNNPVVTPSPTTWAGIPISFEANTTIASEANTSFLDAYYEYEPTYFSVMAYKKISGTVSTYANNTILGTGTIFEIDVANGDSIIVGDDKFVVSSVTSNTELTVLVDSTTSYSNYSLYKL